MDSVAPNTPSIQVQVLSPLDAPGGGAVHARAVARAFREQGARVSVLCTGGPSRREDPDCGTVVACRPPSWPLVWRWPPVATMPYWVRAIRQSTRDVTGIVSLSPILTVATRRARPEIPVVYCPAALNACEQPAERLTLYQRLERQAFRRADAVLVPAEEVRDAVREHYGRSSGRSAVCPLGVDGERLEPVADPRRSFGIPADAFMLLTVGTINANKGQRQIARALAAAARCDWWWVVIGDGPERQVVIDSLRSSAMRERAVFVEEAARLGDWYAAANVLVSASRCETFGLVCAEALWTGLPVLVPENRPGAVLSPLAHTVMAAGLGRTYDRNSPAELLDALTALADDRAGRSDMGARAHGFARRHFSWQRYIECLESLLQPPGEPHWNRDARITISAASGVRS